MQRHHCADKGLYSQGYLTSSSHVQIWELNHKEGWELKNWCFWVVVLEMTLGNLLDCKEIKPVLKEINPEHSLEGLMLKLKLQHCGHLTRTADTVKTWCWQRRKAREDGGRRPDGQAASRDSTDMNLSKLGNSEQGSPSGRRVGHNLVTEQHSSRYRNVSYK